MNRTFKLIFKSHTVTLTTIIPYVYEGFNIASSCSTNICAVLPGYLHFLLCMICDSIDDQNSSPKILK